MSRLTVGEVSVVVLESYQNARIIGVWRILHFHCFGLRLVLMLWHAAIQERVVVLVASLFRLPRALHWELGLYLHVDARVEDLLLIVLNIDP